MQTINSKYPLFEIGEERKAPKYLQVIDCIINAIKQGKLRKDDKILSINELSNEYFCPATLFKRHTTYWSKEALFRE